MERLLQPLLKVDGHYQPITFEDTFQCLERQCALAEENSTLVMASGDYTNEELYLLQRWARTGLKTNALGSFDYYKRGTAFFLDKNDIVPFDELYSASLFVCFWDPQADSASMRNIQQILSQCSQTPQYVVNRPGTLHLHNYAAFFRCVNRYLIQEDLAEGIYVNGLGKGYDFYKQRILAEEFSSLCAVNDLQEGDIQQFVDLVRQSEAPVFLIWERLLDERGIIELENLCMLLNIQAKPASGFLSIKGDLNSQGLYDMGIFPEMSIGGRVMNEESARMMAEIFQHPVVTTPVNVSERVARQAFPCCLLFNSTGAAIPDEVMLQVRNCPFSMLQTAQWDGQSADFNLLLPASLPEEATGTFTDSTRAAHHSTPAAVCPLPYNNLQQLSALGERCGLTAMTNPTDIFMEYISFFQGGCRSQFRHFFR